MISILLPTRQRPHNVVRLIDSLNDTVASKSDVELVIRFDEDDDITRRAIPQFMDKWKCIRVVQMPRPAGSGRLWNEAFSAASGNILMICGDDIAFRTKGWDNAVRFGFNSNPDQIVLVFGPDGRHTFDMATHPFISRRWVEAVGYLGAGKDFDVYIDIWLDSVSRTINRRVYFPDIFTEHMHCDYNKAIKDAVYESAHRDEKEIARVHKRFAETQDERKREAEILLKIINGA